MKELHIPQLEHIVTQQQPNTQQPNNFTSLLPNESNETIPIDSFRIEASQYSLPNANVIFEQSGIDTSTIHELTPVDEDKWQMVNDWWGLEMKGATNVPHLDSNCFVEDTENHIYYDNESIIPVSSNYSRYQGATFRRGVQHVHPGDDHSVHAPVTEGYDNKIDKFIKKFRTAEYNFRKTRKNKL